MILLVLRGVQSLETALVHLVPPWVRMDKLVSVSESVD